MTAATWPRPLSLGRLLHVDRANGTHADHGIGDLPGLLSPGDLLVVNDAATLPASLPASVDGAPLELRLAGPPEEGWVVLFGPGSWRDRTEDREPPPVLAPGAAVTLDDTPVPVLEVSPLSPRLVRLALPPALVWSLGRPVQYSYLDRDLRLADVQTPYATRPWAVEMPSAGRPLSDTLRRALHQRGVGVATLTHAAGLSATGDPALDEALPLPERYEVPEATWAAVQRAPRVVAVGTSVVRALESAARGSLRGVTSLKIGPGTALRVVDGLLSGMHEPGEPHFRMMAAFTDLDRLRAACAHAADAGYANHEFGDSTLVV